MPWRTWPTLKTTTRTSKSATACAGSGTAPTPSAACPKTTSSALPSWIRFPGCKVRCVAQSISDEEALQQCAAIGEAQRATRQGGHRPDALREHAVEGIDGKFHQLVLTLAPAFIGAQGARCTQMFSRRARLQA